MNTIEIKNIIVDQREEIEEIIKREKIIEREVPKKELLKFLSHPNILVISGIRRSGKSITSFMLLENESYGYINFDDERLAGFEAKNLNQLIESFYELYGTDLNYFIFDEIQNIENWQLFVNRLRRTKKIILTGSNANLLSGELSTHLTGRYIEFTICPFSFSEFLKFKGAFLNEKDFFSTKSIARTKKLLNDYLSTGGFPEVYKFGKTIVSRIYSDIINKDVLLRHKIKHKDAFKKLTKFLISSFGNEIVFRKLKEEVSIKDVHTIRNYIAYLENTYLIFLVEKFSFKLKQQMIAPKKVYCMDNGIVKSIAFQFSQNLGRFMENMVAVELYRRKSCLNKEFEIYYWKDYSGKEVDFVVKGKQKVKRLVQVCYSIDDLNVKKRELNSLAEAGKKLRCDDLLLITWGDEGEERYKGKEIKVIPLWKWLLKTEI